MIDNSLQVGLALIPPVAVRGPKARMTEINEMVLRAEAIGLSGIWAYGFPGATPPMLDPLLLSIALTQRFSRLRFGVLGLDLGLRHPTLLARAGASADVLGSGRIDLGVNVFSPAAYEAFGAGVQDPWGRLKESVDALTQIWINETAPIFDKEYFHFYGVTSPRPCQQPHPPVLVMVQNDTADWASIVQLADGWVAPPYWNLDQFGQTAQVVSNHWETSGRKGKPRAVAHLVVNLDAQYGAYEALQFWSACKLFPEQSAFQSLEGASIIGDPDGYLARLNAMQAAGATDVIAMILSDDWRTHLERFNRLVLKQFRTAS